MLQRIHDSLGRWVFGIVVGLISISFIFWGIDFNLTGPTFAAKVNGEEISLTEFEQELQMQQNQFIELYRVELDEELRRQLRRSVIDRLVQREALSQRVDEQGYNVSDERLVDFIRSSAAFQAGGEFSPDVYRNQLALQGLSPAGFEALQRQQLELLDLQVGIADSTFLTPPEYRRYVELTKQQREIAYALFEVDAFVDDVEIADDAIAAHYEENRDSYMTEEAAAIEYVELRRADVASTIEVTDEDLQAYYDEQSDNFRTEEERRARHILITPADGESAEQTEARAAAIVERISAGENFEALAMELSEDPGTAANGGDLGFIGRGTLEGPFEDALFAMEVGQVRGPVQTDFGYHIIRLDEIRAGQEQSFAEVRDQLLEQYRNERADELFYDQANALADRAFDAYDQLAPVAMDLGLPLKTLERLPRSGDSAAFPNSAPIVEAAFGEEGESGVNSPLIELADDHVVVLRVTDQFPPAQQPLEEVAGEIRETLTRQRAEELAAEAAGAFLAALPEALSAEFVGAAVEGAADGARAAGAAGEEGAQAADGDGAQAADDGAGAASEGAADGTDEGAAAAATSPAAQLAAMHGGTWVASKWVERSDANVPTEILAEAFGVRPPEGGARLREPVELATGDRALLILSGVMLGSPDQVAREERDRLQQQLIDQIGTAEIGSYAGSVRDQADVRVPDEVLEPQF